MISASKLGKGESPELNTASSRTSLKGNLLLIVLFSSQNIIVGFKFRETWYNIKLTGYNIIFKSSRARHARGILFNSCNITPNSILLPKLDPKKFIVVRAYSTKSSKPLTDINNSVIQADNKLNPSFITGFVDAEASFIIFIRKTSKSKIE
jgi:hypothetical protein